MYLAIALLGLGSVALAMLQWNSAEAPVDLIPAPPSAEGQDRAGRLAEDR